MRRPWGHVFLILMMSSFWGTPSLANLHVSACGVKPKDPKKTVVLSDLSQSPDPYSELPLLDQGNHHTCYAMASAQFLGAFMGTEDRNRSGGCLPLEQITRERTYGGRIGSEIQQTVDYGHPILSVLESGNQGGCCSSRALRPDQSEAVYRVMNQYSQDVEYAESFLHHQKLRELYDQRYQKVNDQLDSKNSRLEAVREFQRLDTIYESFFDSDGNMKSIDSPEELKKIEETREKRSDQYTLAVAEIEKELFKSDAGFRSLKSKIEALQNEQEQFSPFVDGIAKENAVRKIEYALSPQECIMEPTDQDLVTGQIEDLIRFSLESFARIPDGPMGLINQRVKELCHGKQIPLNAEIKNAKRFVNRAGVENEFIKKLKSNLTGANPKPALLGVCSEVLDITNEKSSRELALYFKSTKASSEGRAQCAEHAIVLIGARWQNGQCQYLVRDSVADRPQQQWVPADILIHAATDVITVR